MNDYEESEGNAERRMQKNDDVRTEDLYQSLQFPPTAHHGTINSTTLLSEHCERKYVFLLFAVNILISAIILVIVGLNLLLSVMELQQRYPVSMNEYEESETTQMRGASQTEDVYQCLQYRPPTVQGTINSTTLLSKQSERKDGIRRFSVTVAEL
ncbi:hypothetical protein cypCar_00035740 [Cyprinus carpio]|nr:hypothetical protein cypCar_00035740 [Cyprinus carpio]